MLSADGKSLEQVRVIFRALPTYDGDLHFGSRLAFGPDGMLYVTLGDRSDTPMRAAGAAARQPHGQGRCASRPMARRAPTIPSPARRARKPEIWSLGHRNVQSAAFDAQGRLLEVEHGTQGGDELNLIEKGRNYGWPLVAYGEEYSGAPIAGARRRAQASSSRCTTGTR